MSVVIESLDQRLTRIEELLCKLIDTRVRKDYYSTAEVEIAQSSGIYCARMGSQWSHLGREATMRPRQYQGMDDQP